ncbi:MAG TPA: caspase family protein [Blastocatellia bacterium]|nr:caspase family protein [Blastocatellia bacterium]
MVKKLFALLLLCTAMAMTAQAQQAPQPRTWAVVVGISKYQKLLGGQQLQFADRDAALFAEAIQKRGVNPQNVKLLTGADATAAAIKVAVGNWLARSVSEADTVLIFFSGHGLFEPEFGESYLLGYDSDPKDPYGTALSVSELGQALARRVRSSRVLVIADAVRRDFFDPESNPNYSKAFEQALHQMTATRAGLSAIIASGPGEFSREGQRWGGHGVFAKHLTDVLLDGAGRTTDLALAAEDLFELLKGRVSEDTSGKQRPWRSGSQPVNSLARGGEPTRMPPPNTQKADDPNLLAASKPVELKPSDALRQPKPDPTITVPIASGQLSSETKPAASPSTTAKPNEAPEVTETKPSPLAPPITAPTASSQSSAGTKSIASPSSTALPNEAPGGTERKPAPLAPPISRIKPEPATGTEKKSPGIVPDDRKQAPAVMAADKEKVEPSRVVSSDKTDPRTTSEVTKKAVIAPDSSLRNPGATPAPTAGLTNPSARDAASDATSPVKATQPAPSGELARAETGVRAIPAAPKPSINPPSAVSVSPERGGAQPVNLSSSVPAARPEAAPSPLVLQLEAAIASGTLIEPRNDSAWDLYQRMLSDPSTASDAARLKAALAAALTTQGRSIVGGDVRGDNISDKVDDFKRAGQMLSRARTLTPDNGEIGALEKLSAAVALLSLQFYDEAERALAPLQTAKLAAVDNALGLVYVGKLDTWRAERAFKRASEIDSKWAAPHYNLALLYRSQQNQAALAEFEAAATNDQSNVNLLVALGDEYFARQQWKQAADAFRKAAALRPSDDNLYTKLGHALYSQGLQDEANREYQKAQELRRKRQ